MLDKDVLRKYIEDSGVSYKKNGRSYIFDCPRCGKRDKLHMEQAGPRTGRFVCWVCKETDNFQGRPEYALAELLNIPARVIQAHLYGEAKHVAGVYLDPQIRDFFGDEDLVDADADQVPTMYWPDHYWPIDHPVYGRSGAEYLVSRGIPLDVATRYGLRYSPTGGRVAFPVTIEGRLVGIQQRAVGDTKVWSEEHDRQFEVPKILSSKGIPREHVVMFSDRLRGYEHVVLCEGPVDAIKADLCGGNVATMGKAVSQQQMAFLRYNGVRKVYLALDPDAAEETSRLVRAFGDLEVYLMHPPSGYKDLGEMSMEEVYQLFAAAPRINPGRLIVWCDRGRHFV